MSGLYQPQEKEVGELYEHCFQAHLSSTAGMRPTKGRARGLAVYSVYTALCKRVSADVSTFSLAPPYRTSSTLSTMAERLRRDKKSALEKLAEYKRAREGGPRVWKVRYQDIHSRVRLTTRV
jgi:hypothetical protein